MPKIKKEEETKDAVMSHEMIRKCKDMIAKYGFDGPKYTNFLISVMAMKNKNTVMKFPVSDMVEYREKFLKDLEYSIGDAFMLDKSSDGEYFVPKNFWDYVRDAKI